MPFPNVLDAELTEIQASRQGRAGELPIRLGDVQVRNHPPSARERAGQSHLVGLALSGGGIRSATFNLGVLQGLARYGILPRFDYLSTVSGGGYIGSWLTTWIKRAGLGKVLEGLSSRQEHEAPAITFLRKFSNYLTPKLGLLSADTLTAVATYARNALLNVAILVASLSVLLILPRLVKIGLASIRWTALDVMPLAAFFFAMAALVIQLNLAWFSKKRGRGLAREVSGPPSAKETRWYCEQMVVVAMVVLPLLLSACLTVTTFEDEGFWSGDGWWMAALLAGVIVILVSLLTAWLRALAEAVPVLVAALLGGLLLRALAELMTRWSPANQVVWGPPLVIAAFLLSAIVYIGLADDLLESPKREWWGRLGAWILAITLGWLVLFGLALAELRSWLDPGRWLSDLLASGWLMTTAGGLLAGGSDRTGKTASSRALVVFSEVAPYVFILGLVAGLSALLDRLVGDYLGEIAWKLAAIALALASGVFLFSWRVGINTFSLHDFYRNRLVRCYFGASREGRKHHPFIGFDFSEDLVRVSDLTTDRPKPGERIKIAGLEEPYFGPYPIVNATLNLATGKELAWQQRKGASFVFTPRHSGYDSAQFHAAETLKAPAYRPTDGYRGAMSLGTAMAISGAAASPNMGYYSSTALAFLMTVFNLRLGWWLGNPAGRSWASPGPRLGLLYLFIELFGMADDAKDYVYLSDGGHFENLGVYELVKRRCRFILVSDAGKDGEMKFGDLGNAVEKCRTDFGVEIEIDVSALSADKETKASLRRCAVGRIRYDKLDPALPEGTLVYLRPVLTGDEPADVRRYAALEPAFPHQTTADQWFDEAQFESYRALGEHTADSILSPLGEPRDARLMQTEEIFVGLKEHWYPPSARVAAHFTKHSAELGRILDRIRESEASRFLDAQVIPEWPAISEKVGAAPANRWLPETAEELRAGFYLSMEIMQLMENVYIDLNLEAELAHPDNRGWMNFFKHWSWSGMFRVTWAVASGMYGARFQRFCEKHLDLGDGQLEVGDATTIPVAASRRDEVLERLEAAKRLNFVEADLVRTFLPKLPKEGEPYALYPLNVVVSVPKLEERLFLTVGFALVRGGVLYYFRVQDHLRKMGLGRKALTALMWRFLIQKLDQSWLPKETSDADFPSQEEQRAFRRMFDSVRASGPP